MTIPICQPPEVDDEGQLTAAGMRTVLDYAEHNIGERLREMIEEQADKARQSAVREAAEKNLLYRDAMRMTDQLEQERSGREDTWLPQDLNDAFDLPPQLPEVGAFIASEKSNGGGVFYKGKVNEIHGPSESGKTMLALAVVAQEIRQGNNTVMIDFEDDARAIVYRLHYVFGLTRQEITAHLFYYRPDQAFGDGAFDQVTSHENVTICLIDAVTEGMSAAGLDGRNENEVAQWFETFPKRIARTGPAVVLIDHTPAADGARAIGSQHKKSAVDGVSYTAESISRFAKGRSGQLRIKVAKDKVGGIRPDALPQKDGQEWRGDLRIDGTENPSAPRVGLWGVEPALLHGGGGDDSHLDRGVMPGGPSENDKRAVIVALENGPRQGMSANALHAYIGGRKANLSATLEWMRNSGELLWVKEGNSTIHGLPPVKGEDVQEELDDAD